jgi:hypothetical protein
MLQVSCLPRLIYVRAGRQSILADCSYCCKIGISLVGSLQQPFPTDCKRERTSISAKCCEIAISLNELVPEPQVSVAPYKNDQKFRLFELFRRWSTRALSWLLFLAAFCPCFDGSSASPQVYPVRRWRVSVLTLLALQLSYVESVGCKSSGQQSFCSVDIMPQGSHESSCGTPQSCRPCSFRRRRL